MPQPLPQENPTLWDYLVIKKGPFEYKLLCDYEGERKTRVASHAPISGEGSEQSGQRRQPATFTFTIRVFTDQQMADYEEVLSSLMYRSTKLATVKVEHPALAQLGVTELLLESVSALKPAGPGRELLARWSMTERRPVKHRKTTPTAPVGREATTENEQATSYDPKEAAKNPDRKK